jgi:hypothetical protein
MFWPILANCRKTWKKIPIPLMAMKSSRRQQIRKMLQKPPLSLLHFPIDGLFGYSREMDLSSPLPSSPHPTKFHCLTNVLSGCRKEMDL